jgi:Mn2+/Fe2+ NRAMP family transporter
VAKKKTREKAQGGKKKQGFLARLGPGLITGASDDDPSGIGTYSQAGAPSSGSASVGQCS